MKRHYFICEDLTDLESFQRELEDGGILTQQIHVLTLDTAAADSHEHIHEVHTFMKRDVIHAGEYGFAAGVVAAAAVLLVTYLAGWYQNPLGWVPFIFLAIIALGFLSWEGGFIGFQTFNRRFAEFKGELDRGSHVFFVDLTGNQEPLLQRAMRHHPSARPAGTGRARPIGWCAPSTASSGCFGTNCPEFPTPGAACLSPDAPIHASSCFRGNLPGLY